MDPEEKREEIFAAAIEIEDRSERDSYVARACGDDRELLEKVQKLLHYHDEHSFLDTPALEIVTGPKISTPTEHPGMVIGRYKLLERIGEGGMAVVYMAEQERPIRRKVALKIIKLGMDTKSVIARFEAERQALAIMDHPNIAKVFDAGATESGRPYFVMELVEGTSITSYCDENRLGTEERLALFNQICNAVQHAHQKGIIHRDLKPSNVLIMLQDGAPTPKVIDFGIAKATKQRLTEKTMFTRYAQMIGTPTYMSPEQAELSDLEIDIRTDIYSLGILLYELLTGTTPFSEEQLRKAGYIEMQRIICQEEPAKPSTKLTALGEELTDIAEHRDSTPDVLTKAVRGDLDWIVMKSIEKERSRRYETADGLAGDIQRHLDDEPVLARPPDLVYRLRKFLRRHQLQVVTVLMMALFGVAVIFSLSIWNQYRHQLEASEPIAHRQTLARARKFFSVRDFQAALKDAETILNSRHVGPEAQLLYASILVKSQQPDDAVFILENLLDERPEIAGDARDLLIKIYLDVELSDAERLRIAQKVAGKTIYVDVNAAGTNDGTSWADAYNSLQDALMAAVNGDEIKVAAGVYKPDKGAKVTPGDRKAAFQLKQGVAVYGGIGGESILSGDLNGDDGPDFTGNAENSYHIVNGSDTNEVTVLKDFTITAGNAKSDKTNDAGGGMYTHTGSPTVTNCTFRGNSAIDGGGMVNANESNPTITNCIFIGNSAEKTAGAMWNHWYSRPIVANCTFVENSANSKGGMKNQDSNPIVKNCRFIRNSAETSGAGMNNLYSSPTVINCTFEDNSAGLDGAGMSNRYSNPTLTKCVFSGNSANKKGGGIINWDKSNPTIDNCVFSGNSAKEDGGGMINDNSSSPTLTNCVFIRNSANKNGGGIKNSDKSNPKITNCIFSGNVANEYGGGMYNGRGSLTLTNCLFSGNSAGQRGGGIAEYAVTDPNITNITNCTFSENMAPKGGALAYWNNCISKLTNCILWNNTATRLPQISLEYSSITVKCCNLQGGLPKIYVDQKSSVTWDSSNIDCNPLFVNSSDGDYHLQADSPSVNAGDNSAIPPSVTVDLDENPRILNDIVDMGVYECNSPSLPHLRASNPSPVDRANIGSVSQVELRWERTSDVSTYKVYFSTDPDSLTLYGNVQQKNFMMSPVLKNNCRHFWRVDAIQSDGSVIPGIVWSFSTVEGFDLYIDDIEPNITKSSKTTKGLLNYCSEDHPVSGNHCIHWTGANLWDSISFRFSRIKDLSMQVSEGFVVGFWVRCDGPGTSIVLRFRDTKTDDPGDHPWRMIYTIDQRVAVWDGQWHYVQIPLYAFFEQGSEENGEWFNPIGVFDWTAIEYFEIVAEFSGLKGVHFYFDDIRIVDPNPASLESGIKPKVNDGIEEDAD